VHEPADRSGERPLGAAALRVRLGLEVETFDLLSDEEREVAQVVADDGVF